MTFYQRKGKRVLDFALALPGLALLFPFFLIVAILVKATSDGPVFFCQTRIGKNGRPFSLVKFRSMIHENAPAVPSITVSGDNRITRLGAWLRRYKIDELPQLWNVVKGDMSLVGPRPEVEPYVKGYSDEQLRVLSVRPGVTDPASLFYRHEELVLARHPDPGEHYRTGVLPHKLSLNLDYIDHISLRYDMALILSTLRSLFF